MRDSGVRPGWFRVDLLVSAIGRSLVHLVEFHLHETFSPSVQVVKPKADEARLTVLAWGAFTAGVIADRGQTRLQLNLADDTSLSREFREK